MVSQYLQTAKQNALSCVLSKKIESTWQPSKLSYIHLDTRIINTYRKQEIYAAQFSFDELSKEVVRMLDDAHLRRIYQDLRIKRNLIKRGLM